MADHTVSAPAITESVEACPEPGRTGKGTSFQAIPGTPAPVLVEDALCLFMSAAGALEHQMLEISSMDTDPMWGVFYLLRQGCILLEAAADRAGELGEGQHRTATPPAVDFSADRLHATATQEVAALQKEVGQLRARIEALGSLSLEGFQAVGAMADLTRKALVAADGGATSQAIALAALTCMHDKAFSMLELVSAEAEAAGGATVEEGAARRVEGRSASSVHAASGHEGRQGAPTDDASSLASMDVFHAPQAPEAAGDGDSPGEAAGTEHSVGHLRAVIRTMDGLSQEAFSEIAAVARLALASLETPKAHENTADIAGALQSIWGRAQGAEDAINGEACNVDAAHVDTAWMRRCQASREARAGRQA